MSEVCVQPAQVCVDARPLLSERGVFSVTPRPQIFVNLKLGGVRRRQTHERGWWVIIQRVSEPPPPPIQPDTHLFFSSDSFYPSLMPPPPVFLCLSACFLQADLCLF